MPYVRPYLQEQTSRRTGAQPVSIYTRLLVIRRVFLVSFQFRLLSLYPDPSFVTGGHDPDQFSISNAKTTSCFKNDKNYRPHFLGSEIGIVLRKYTHKKIGRVGSLPANWRRFNLLQAQSSTNCYMPKSSCRKLKGRVLKRNVNRMESCPVHELNNATKLADHPARRSAC